MPLGFPMVGHLEERLVGWREDSLVLQMVAKKDANLVENLVLQLGVWWAVQLAKKLAEHLVVQLDWRWVVKLDWKVHQLVVRWAALMAMTTVVQLAYSSWG